ncbi:LysR family transcriptional regulator [Aliidiomarina taiwanensis]|uniref:LysR family transcriptional regulator n=1 Tax=Aliidiomarina taiwanensis TaxID=946228 RepID=A0A432XB46_9GAMM|nr:LysR family transcriptional regulator [Aliidiomarina taiwanensis]RUO44461.1 LysR family transcriptional regulator [Aliidiomarina taiwanensis]
MLRVTLEQWRMFRAVVQYGGFNQAAASIHKSQSSIHNAVSKIENSLNVKLFQVEGRTTHLTEAGKLMLRRANFLLDEAAKLEIVGQSLGQGTETSLRIAVDEMFPPALLYQVLEQVSSQYPLLQVELVESVLSGASELISNADVDLAISPLAFTEGFCEQLCTIEFLAVANPNHALHALGRKLTEQDLKSHRQLVVRDSALTNRSDSGWLGANQRWTVSHLRTSIDMICNGLGFAWLPVSAIQEKLTAGTLKPLPLQHNSKRTMQLYLVFKDEDSLGPAGHSFIHELRNRCNHSD